MNALLLALALTASAAEWSDFEPAFPKFPCQDGWMACRVGDTMVSPELLTDRDGMPSPADLRLSFWTLQPMPAFNPWLGLSSYPETVELTDTEEDEVEPPDDSHDAVVDAVVDPRREVVVDKEPAKADVRRDKHDTVDKDAVKKQVDAPAEPHPTADAPKDPPKRPDGESAARAAPSCDDLQALEPMAMLGKLSPDQVSCLESRFGGATRQTDKDRISRVEMNHYRAANDRGAWARTMRRHLAEVDQSDPDLTLSYALYLAKSCPSGAEGAIHWADKALERRFVWTGSSYVDKVYSLYKIRAASSQCLWRTAEDAHAEAPTDETKRAAEDTRNKTKQAARDWYEYAKEAGRDTSVALQLCVSAAGTASFCKGE